MRLSSSGFKRDAPEAAFSYTPAITPPATFTVALVHPLRRGTKTTLDRRIYRNIYDARQTLERFSAGLREEVDLPALRERLTEVVKETVQPTHLSLWLRETPRDQPR